jgi:hypothetical protein
MSNMFKKKSKIKSDTEEEKKPSEDAPTTEAERQRAVAAQNAPALLKGLRIPEAGGRSASRAKRAGRRSLLIDLNKGVRKAKNSGLNIPRP